MTEVHSYQSGDVVRVIKPAPQRLPRLERCGSCGGQIDPVTAECRCSGP